MEPVDKSKTDDSRLINESDANITGLSEKPSILKEPLPEIREFRNKGIELHEWVEPKQPPKKPEPHASHLNPSLRPN